jgi:hypothetical protein
MKKNGRLDDEPPVFFFADFRRVGTAHHFARGGKDGGRCPPYED